MAMVMLERDGRLIDTNECDVTTSEELLRPQEADGTPQYTILDRLVFAALDHITGPNKTAS